LALIRESLSGFTDALAEALELTPEQYDYLYLGYFAPKEYMRRYHPDL
jgi:hypothetical protein